MPLKALSQESTVELQLDRLAELRDQLAAADSDRRNKLNALLDLKVAARVQSIEDEHNKAIETLAAQATQIEAEIKQSVLARGQSVKGSVLHAIWMKGRVTWDGSGLDGFAVAHPEMGQFRRVGDPSVSIRKIA